MKVAQLCPALCNPMDCVVHEIFQARVLERIAFPFSRGSSQPKDQTQVSRIAGGFCTSWATGKPKNTSVGSLSLLQGIFLTQESNQGLLHCRRILYQLSYQGSHIFLWARLNSFLHTMGLMATSLPSWSLSFLSHKEGNTMREWKWRPSPS